MAIHVRNNFCIAPFTQLTFGPTGVYSPCAEIGGRAWKEPSASPIAMWSSDEFNALRESFGNNEKNSICNRCWDQEEHKNHSLRKRLLTQGGLFKKGEVIDFVNNGFKTGPVQMNLMTGNKCNLRCRICKASSSVTFNVEGREYEKKLKKKTIYTNSSLKPHSYNKEQIDEIYQLSGNLQRLEFYGGEPLLDEPTLGLLERLVDAGRSRDIVLFYNTNGTVMPTARQFKLWNQFKGVEFNFSIDDIGDRFTYNRHPGKWTDVLATIAAITSYPWNVSTKFLSICTVGSLNVYYLPETLTELERLGLPSFLNTVFGPDYYGIEHLPIAIKSKVVEKLQTYKDITKVQFVINMLQNTPENLDVWNEFKFWTKEKDAYRKESFAEVCPEYYKIITDYDKDF
jgi:MoaA/NifB/PqqE/SkfB family radical SAM enzyme